MTSNIYEAEVPSAELRRLQVLEYPLSVSKSLLPHEIAWRTVLDVGAGPNTLFGHYISRRNGLYTAVDVNPLWLEKHKELGFETLVASVTQLPLAARAVDIGHVRFVLMHLSESDRLRAVREVLRVSGSSAIFIEYDWMHMGGPSVVEDFKGTALEFFAFMGIEPYMGGKLRGLVDAQRSDNTRLAYREIMSVTDDYGELVQLAESMADFARQSGQTVLKEKLLWRAAELVALSCRSRPPHFRRADVCSVVVERV